jgi:hypothetical protein
MSTPPKSVLLQTHCQKGKQYNNHEMNCDHNTGRKAMSQANNIIVLRVEIFIKFNFGSKTSDISIINVKAISRLGV